MKLTPTRKAYFGDAGVLSARIELFETLRPERPLKGPAIIESPFTTVVIDPGARAVRKRSGMTLEELSMRCVHLDREAAPRDASCKNDGPRLDDIVAIEVINRLCQPCSEFALAEHWYASTALDDLLGDPSDRGRHNRHTRGRALCRRAALRTQRAQPGVCQHA